MSSTKFKQLSPAEFFYNNRSMAGFDNPTRAVYTVVRELIENSLDACDAHGIKPLILVSLKRISSDELEVLIADNGVGVPSRYIADAFGRVFFGSKYTIRQSRGTFGLGGKMAILYGQLTTGEPVSVATSVGGDIYTVKLSIDVRLNQPIVHQKKVVYNPSSYHGTTVMLRFKGDYVSARSRIIKYLRMTRIALPYASIMFFDPDNQVFLAPALTDSVPKPPTESKPHPYGVDIIKVKEMIDSSKRDVTVLKFLQKFSRIGSTTASRFAAWVGFDPNRPVKKLSDEEIKKMVEGFKSYTFLPPDGSSLSPLGEQIIRTGLASEYNPEFIAVTTRPPSAYEGFSFIVEAALAYGGGINLVSTSNEVRLLRFANKIPLIYDSSNDVAMRVIEEDIDWANYSLDPKIDPLLIFVHIAASKVPFKTAGKEYVADREEVRREIRLALRKCARDLKTYISKKKREQNFHMRNEKLSSYLSLINKYSSTISGKSPLGDEYISKLIKGAKWDDSEEAT
ncbi:MAG: DNA topoisomerase VI subunit B [Thermoprotei archaeon]